MSAHQNKHRGRSRGGAVKRRRRQWYAFSRRLCWNGEVRSVSFLGDRCGHGGSYGPSRRRRQLLDLHVQLPDDPLHGFAALDQIRGDVSPSEVLKEEAAPRRPTARHFHGSCFCFWALICQNSFSSAEEVPAFQSFEKKKICVGCFMCMKLVNWIVWRPLAD